MALAIALVLAVVPSALILRYFVRRDEFPEPRRAIAITFAWGIGSIVPAVILALGLLLAIDAAFGDQVTDPWLRGAGIAFFGAAIPEELFSSPSSISTADASTTSTSRWTASSTE